MPPIKAIFQDDIIVGIEPSSIESINDTLDVLKRHTENVAHISEDIHKSERGKLLKHEYTQSEVRNYINNKNLNSWIHYASYILMTIKYTTALRIELIAT